MQGPCLNSDVQAARSCSEPGRPSTPELHRTISGNCPCRGQPDRIFSSSDSGRATPTQSKLLRARPRTPSYQPVLRAQSLPSPELQALLSPYNSAACGRKSPLLRGSEVKNSELWLQMAPASAVCGELGLPSLEREVGTRTKSDLVFHRPQYHAVSRRQHFCQHCKQAGPDAQLSQHSTAPAQVGLSFTPSPQSRKKTEPTEHNSSAHTCRVCVLPVPRCVAQLAAHRVK